MKRAKEFHDRAMKYADAAFLAKFKGHADEAKRYFEKAFLEEKQAALIIASSDTEPTRSVLHRSAATLALKCGENREAEKIAARALAGEPPDEIADELRDILDKAGFERHLELQDLNLDKDNIQVTFDGNAVRDGLAPRKEVFSRVREIEKLLHRTEERVNNRSFSEIPNTKNRVELYVAPPIAASFSMTLKLGVSKQLSLPTFEVDNGVIDEFMTCMELLGRRQLQQLQEQIPDPAYFRNFVGIAKKIAPDGDNISFVGLISMRGGTERRIGFTLNQSEITVSSFAETSDQDLEVLEEKATVSGKLLFADALKGKQNVKLKESDGKTWTILVAVGLMEDVVRPHWGRFVNIQGYRVKKKRKLSHTLQFIEFVTKPSEMFLG